MATTSSSFAVLKLALAPALLFALLASSSVSANTVTETFTVQNMTVQKLCQQRVITAVNGMSPGPQITVHEGDKVQVTVINRSSYNVTIHWHGIFQKLTPWADGPEYTTQCPIQPGQSYIYEFTITGQEGTLWWHAHSQWLRATVYGALIILPPQGRTYPFSTPYQEYPIILGEYWNANIIDVENQALATGGGANNSNAYLINGQPGVLYNCSQNDIYTLNVIQGQTYLLRIINSALYNQLFFKIAYHIFTVVAADASYTEPYETDVLILSPAQTLDVLVTANQSKGCYYMAASPYSVVQGTTFDNTTTTGLLVYNGTPLTCTPSMPTLPAYNDTDTVFEFDSGLRGLTTGPYWTPPPQTVDKYMEMTVGLGLVQCGANETCSGPLGQRLAASSSNYSLQFPNKTSMLQADYQGSTNGVYNTGFPDQPQVQYNYTDTNNSFNTSLVYTAKNTTLIEVSYNTTMQMVLQDTALVGTDSHPMHLHSFNFWIIAMGFGNYDPSTDSSKFNLVNPSMRNVVRVPTAGWAVIRFQANNPGIWLIHCHIDEHLTWGLGTALVVDNGGTPSSNLPPPPFDLPQC